MKRISKVTAILMVFLAGMSFGGDFGWDEKYEKQFDELEENTDWGRSELRSLTVDRWSKEKIYK